MTDIFDATFFAGNRRRLRAAVADDTIIVLTAHALLQRGADMAYPFHQDSSFWYVSGIEFPEVVLVMDGEDEFCIVSPREAVREAFDGAIDNAKLTEVSGIKNIYDEITGWKKLTQKLKTAPSIAILDPNPEYIEFYAMYSNPARAKLKQKLHSIAPKTNFLDIRKDIARLRMIKQAPELLALDKAIDITSQTISEIVQPDNLATYAFEYEIEAALSYGFRSRGARGHAFDPVVASGLNAATIHSMSNNGRLEPETLLVLDVGADYAHYGADITRTYSLNGQPSDRQAAVFAAVLDVQQYAMGLMKPGVMVREYEKQVETYMGEHLRALGLISSDKKDDIRRYYPHACSHFLGIDPHDAGDYDLPLGSGAVLTVEPGIYIPEESIGVRIEDDILITEDGNKVLSSALPRQLTANA